MGVIGQFLGGALGGAIDQLGGAIFGKKSEGEVGSNIGRQIGSFLPFEQGGMVLAVEPKERRLIGMPNPFAKEMYVAAMQKGGMVKARKKPAAKKPAAKKPAAKKTAAKKKMTKK